MASPSSSSATLSIHWDEDEESSIKIPTHGLIVDIDKEDSNDNFVLPEELCSPGSENDLSPPMRAASHPDSRILKAVLSDANKIYNTRVCADLARRRENGIALSPDLGLRDFAFPLADLSFEFGPNSLRVVGCGRVGIATPLLEAIRSEKPENVNTLLAAGANPNGIPRYVMEDYAAFFMRFRPRIPTFTDMQDLASRKEFLKLMDLPQVSRLTLEEVEDRFWDGMAPFWCEEGFTPKDFYPNGGSIPSLVQAAKCWTTEIFDRILDAGADASFWMLSQSCVPNNPTESSLSVSSPLHAAIEARNLQMVEHLLGIGFEPNVMALATPTRCYTPLMATILESSDFCKEAFDLLASHPKIDFEIRTPVYKVHLLHFAVARLDLGLLKHVASKTRLENAGCTELGHTLLHIACMPADSLHVQRRAEVIYRSVHETRDLSPRNDAYAPYPPEFDGNIEDFEGHFAAQAEVVKYLWFNGVRDIQSRDVHGNTALHYLAGCQSVNWELLRWLDNECGVQRIWEESKNEVGASPEELAWAGQAVRDEGKSGWCEWFERHSSRARAMRKEEVWEAILGERARESRSGRYGGTCF